MAVNALGVMHAVSLAHATGARLLFASTSETYGDPLEHPQRETYWGNVNPVGVRACYDEAKRYGGAYLTSAVRELGVDGPAPSTVVGAKARMISSAIIPKNVVQCALRSQGIWPHPDR
jgi:nucleoside-diphosphate-sugar epimerase